MRKLLLSFLALTVSITFTPTQAASDDAQEGASSGKVQVVFESNIDLHIPDLHCDKTGCCPTVSGTLADNEGVNNVDVNVDKKSARVTFDPSKTSQEAILAALAAAGIKASKAADDADDDTKEKKDSPSDSSS